MKDRLIEIFGIDTRSLAVFRIGLALLIITDLLLRARDLGAHSRTSACCRGCSCVRGGVAGVGLGLVEYPELLGVLTHIVIAIESCGLVIAFSPFRSGPARTLAVVLFVGFHAGILLTMKVGIFALVCMVAWILFLPHWFWRQLGSAAAGGEEPKEVGHVLAGTCGVQPLPGRARGDRGGTVRGFDECTELPDHLQVYLRRAWNSSGMEGERLQGVRLYSVYVPVVVSAGSDRTASRGGRRDHERRVREILSVGAS